MCTDENNYKNKKNLLTRPTPVTVFVIAENLLSL